jgi:hypothetical protein
MAVKLEHRFGRESRVRDYWLAASEGFAVQSRDGRPLGTVRQVVHERDGRAAALLVEARRGLVGTEEVVLEAEVVEEVAPWRSTLVVSPDEVATPAPAVRWPALRRAAAARVAAAFRGAVAGVRRDVAFARAHWPGLGSRLLHAWAWIVATAVDVVAAAVLLLAQLVRAVAARLTQSR